MATPYLQNIHDGVVSTQDLARADLGALPQVVIASSQSKGRGRTGAAWMNAARSLAVSFAWRPGTDDDRPFSLIAGVAAVRAAGSSVKLKWPNDVISGESKVGGILVEVVGDIAVAGLGMNLYWQDPPVGIGAMYDEDPGPNRYVEVGALWAAEFNSLIERNGWPIDEYRELCQTLGREITWDPNGKGLAAGISGNGSLLVETAGGIQELYAGAIRYVR